MKVLLIIFACCLSAIAQTQNDFHHKYGIPLSETYEVKPGIYITATFADTGEVCQLIITPQLAAETLNYPSTKTMNSSSLTEIINELVPIKDRGKPLGGGFANLTCLPLNNCAGVFEDYEYLSIFRNGSTDQERFAVIQWIKRSCQKK